MSKPLLTIIKLMNISFFLLILLVAVPVHSGPKERSDLSQSPPAKGLSDQECDEAVVGKGDSKCLPKEAGKPKKKVVKKAGTAAAIGVAGKKVSGVVGD